ncbi:RNA polymerase subunit sigma-70 [marine bacterium AO1-C]|nr:RNA polymerase subunit sigma-70 [marine bacterium AO1-C]
MKNPFSQETYDHTEDMALINQALEGSAEALENLVKRHQHYIYNVALKMVLSPFDAEDITQEVLIKLVTKLGQFQGKSNFRTWLYRITFNHFLKMKKYWLEDTITSFENYGQELDQMENVDLSAEQQIAQKELIKEAKFGCMLGMLLCLSREQRLVYILGEVFQANHTVGAQLLDISKDNFRKRLQRARQDLYQFMNHKCGLVNQANPCRCSRKTTSFIKAGWVDPKNMKFNTDYLHTIQEEISPKNQQLDELLQKDYQELFQDTPFQEKQHAQKVMKNILQDRQVKEVFNL